MKKLVMTTLLATFLILICLSSAQAVTSCQGATYDFYCGDTINESCVFTASMNCSAGGGFEIDTNSVIVNCYYFQFAGPGYNSAFNISADEVEIKECNITDWDYGADIRTGSNGTIIDYNNFTSIGYSSVLEFGDGFTQVYHNNLSNGGNVAIDIQGGGFAAVENNTIQYSVGAIRTGALVTDNYISRNTIKNVLVGIYIGDDSNVVDRNKISEFLVSGMDIQGYYNNITYNNLTDGDILGIGLLRADENLIQHNRIINISDMYSYGEAITLDISDYNIIDNNYIADADEIAVLLNSSESNNITNNEIVKMTQSNSFQNGIGLYYTSDYNLIRANYIHGYNNYTTEENCIYIDNSYVTNVSGNNLTTCFNGVYIDNGNGEQIEKNAIDCSQHTGDVATGVTLIDGDSNVVWKNNITHCSDGIYADYQDNMQIASNRILQGFWLPYGLDIGDITDSYAYNNIIEDQNVGVVAFNTDAFEYTGNNMSDCQYGYQISASSGTFGDYNRLNNVAIDLVLFMADIDFTNFVTQQTKLDVSGINFYLYDYVAPVLPDPANHHNIGIYYNVSGNGLFPVAIINMTYSPSGLTNESALKLWEHNNTGWFEVTGSQVYTGDHKLDSGMLTGFSVFAPMDQGNQPYSNNTNVPYSSCAMLWFLLIILALCVVLLAGWMFYFFYEKAMGGNSAITDVSIGVVVMTSIGLIVLISLLVEIANEIQALCWIW